MSYRGCAPMARRAALVVALFTLATAVSAAGPPRLSGGLRFGSAAVVDPSASAARPAIGVASDGTVWVAAASRGTVVVRRSSDGGVSFRPVAATGFGPADSVALALDDADRVYVAAAQGGARAALAVSGDHGASWQRGFAAGEGPVSLAVDNGPSTRADDDTAFLALGGLVYASAGDAFFRPAGNAGCGEISFDPARRQLFLPCASGGRVAMSIGQVTPQQRTGITFTSAAGPSSPGGRVAGSPTVVRDAAGTVYAVWSDAVDGNVYFSASGDGGVSWGEAARVNGNDAVVGVLPDAAAAAEGSLAIVWLGSDPQAGPRWYGYATLVTAAGSPTPQILQQRLTAKPVRLGDPDGDPPSLALARDGGLLAAYSDSSSADGAGVLSVSAQLAGPTPRGGSIDRPTRGNPIADAAGDAPAPQLDLTRLELSQPDPSHLRVRMSVASFESLVAPAGPLRWVTRFNVLSRSAAGALAYRALYVGAEGAGGAPSSFFAGSATCVGAGCDVLAYPPTVRVPGRVEGRTITIDVPLEGGFGPGAPLDGDLLYDVEAFSFGASGDADSTAPVDYKLEQRIARTTGRGRHLLGSGAIRGAGGGRASFRLDVFQQKTGRLAFADARGGIRFVTTRILKVRLATRQRARITGTGLLEGKPTPFAATLVDGGRGGRRDTFWISVGRRYRRGGRLLSGDLTIR